MPAPPIPSVNGGPAAASATSEAHQSVGGVNFTGGAQIGASGPGQNPYLITKAVSKVVTVVSVLAIIAWVFVRKKGR